MKNAIVRALSVLLASAALAGCYAQVEDGSVAITHPLCDPSATTCVPGGNTIPLGLINISGLNTLKIPLGGQDFLKSETKSGPVTFRSSVTLNQMVLTMLTSGADFAGVTEFKILVAPRESNGLLDDPCATPTICPVIASYDRSTDGAPAPATTLVLKGSGQNLIDLMDQQNQQLILELQAGGTLPNAPSWNADLTMNVAMSARASFP